VFELSEEALDQVAIAVGGADGGQAIHADAVRSV
jgi:hypothetical protein